MIILWIFYLQKWNKYILYILTLKIVIFVVHNFLWFHMIRFFVNHFYDPHRKPGWFGLTHIVLCKKSWQLSHLHFPALLAFPARAPSLVVGLENLHGQQSFSVHSAPNHSQLSSDYETDFIYQKKNTLLDACDFSYFMAWPLFL